MQPPKTRESGRENHSIAILLRNSYRVNQNKVSLKHETYSGYRVGAKTSSIYKRDDLSLESLFAI